MKKIKAVLFDFDGTLMDTNRIVLESWYHVYDTLGVPRDPDEKIVRTFGESLQDSLAAYFPGHDPEELLKVYRSYQQHHFRDLVHPFEGMPELIHELKDRGYKLAIVTSRLWQTLKNNCYDFRDEAYFDVIVDQNDTKAHKPDPEPCLIALRKLGVAADEAVMIGDAKYDTLCAKNAGVTSVLVAWSLACPPEKAVGDAKPDFIIEKPSDLLEILE